MSSGPLPLRDRVAVVTGASRRAGIGYATARLLAGMGASVFLHHFAPHDHLQPWGADPGGPRGVLDGVAECLVAGARLADLEVDLADPDGPCLLVEAAVAAFGHIDVLVCNHARSAPDGGLSAMDAEILDGHWAVDARSSILLVKHFAAQHDGRAGGSIVLLTSGQDRGPMPGEIAYAAAKGALASITKTLADELADAGITLNTVNPGPVDTGYLSGREYQAVAERFPGGRWATPEDPARLIAWLTTDDARWITGQVIDTEGGFRR